MMDLVLPLVALMLVAATGWWLAPGVLPRFEGRWERPLLAASIALAWCTGAAMLLAELGWFSRGAIMTVLTMGAVGAAWRHRKSTPLDEAAPPPGWGLETAPALLVSACAVAIACVSAWMLPVWQWDSLGYHLPFVNFVLQRGARADVPALIPYISTYPHGIEHLFLVLRALLPNDDLVDVGQVPLGIVGALATAGLCERLGGKAALGLAAGALWLTLPAVFLQLPTNYVDVGAAMYLLLAAYWLLSPPSRTHAARPYFAGAVALGLYLGSKPSAPLPTFVLAVVLAVRLWPLTKARGLLAAATVVAAFGAESYVRNFIATSNPLWPIALELGPFKLAGARTVETLVAAGAAAPRPHGGFLARVLSSWTTLHGPPAFDMRLGGWGPVMLLLVFPALLFAVPHHLRIRRQLTLLWAVAVAAALAHPEPSTPRFVLAFPALLLAFVAASAAQLPRTQTAIVSTYAAVLAGWAVLVATPGFSPGNDFSPLQLGSSARAAYKQQMGPDGPPTKWREFTAPLSAAHLIAYDESFTLPGLLWNAELTNGVLPLPWGITEAELQRTLLAKGVTHLIAGRQLPSSGFISRQPLRFERLFACGSDPCDVYRVRPEAMPPAP